MKPRTVQFIQDAIKRRQRWLSQPPFPWRKGFCRWCDEPVSGRRRSWCSDQCVHEYKIRSDGGYVRSKLFERDAGICQSCGLDCPAFEKEMKALLQQCKADATHRYGSSGCNRYHNSVRVLNDGACKFCVEADRTRYVHQRAYWEAEHVVAVIEGGGCCGLDGFTTLCVACHLQSTTALVDRRAARRRVLADLVRSKGGL